MTKTFMPCPARLRLACAALLASSLMTVIPAPALAQAAAERPANQVTLSVGAGRMVRLDAAMTDLFVANDAIADVQVRSSNQIYIFGKGAGETTVYATNAAGRVVYSANVRVGNNIDSIDSLLQAAMPEAQIQATTMNGVVLLTGTVSGPNDGSEAVDLVQAFVGDQVKVVSRLKTATPLQVMLRVRIAEVNRSLVKEVGFNLLSRDNSGGFLFGIGQGTPGTIKTVTDANDPSGIPQGGTLYNFNNNSRGTSLGAAGNLLGLDLLATLDLAENDGKVTTLAEPTLTALSGETASFLAGGEFPIPISQSLGTVTIEYKAYGVGLSFTPTVLDNGRISMRVRPEVSELSTENVIELNGYDVPALVTRRAETTVELGSGQSFVIGGLLRNVSSNAVQKAPWLGDLPILGALFRSSSFRRAETELVIVVTPYLVKPVSDRQIALPTDGFRIPNEAERVALDQQETGVSAATRPAPVAAPPRSVNAAAAGAAAPAAAAVNPGFSFN